MSDSAYTRARAGSTSAGPTSAGPTSHMQRLLEQSLIAWRVIGRVRAEEDGAIVIVCLGREVRVARARSDLPFRWMVTADGRERPALSITAVLRHVRGALDPTYEKVRVRIAPVPLGD